MKLAKRCRGMWPDVRRSFVLAGLGAILGFAVNARHPRGLPWDTTWADLTAATARAAGIGRLPMDKASEEIQMHTHIILDARNWRHYREGHIPGALSFPPAAFDARFPLLQFLLSAEQPILLYGAGPQDDAPLILAALLSEQGYERIVLLAEGWEGWRLTGLPAERGPGPM